MLVDEQGFILHRLIEQGDYLRIDIPGPGPTAGGGSDWVTVERIEDHSELAANVESFGLNLRPSAVPGNATGTVAHFFRQEATSTFIAERLDREVRISYYGRNELPNKETGSLIDNIRNSIVALGAAAALSELQWSALCKGILSEEIGR